MTTMKAPSFERFTPARAKKILNTMNPDNRKLRDGVAEKYAADMKAGTWTECADPIIFYDDGTLANGQHRMWAVVESETTQTFLVLYDFPRPAALNLDRGLGRDLSDNVHFSGRGDRLDNRVIHISRAIEDGDHTNGANRRPDSQRLEIIERHREASEWIVKHGPKGRYIGTGPVRGAIGRAWYAEADKDKLARFCEVMTTGFAQGDAESAAVAIRNYLLAKGAGAAQGSGWRDTFLKVQNAIHYFMRGKKLHIIKGVQDEVYPDRAPKTHRRAA